MLVRFNDHYCYPLLNSFQTLLSILPIVFLLPLSFFPTNHKVSSLWKTTASTYLLICKSVSSSVSSFVFILVSCFVWGWGQKVRVHFKLCYTTESPHLTGFPEYRRVQKHSIWARLSLPKAQLSQTTFLFFPFYSTVTLPPSWGQRPQPLLLLLFSTQATSGTPAGSQHFNSNRPITRFRWNERTSGGEAKKKKIRVIISPLWKYLLPWFLACWMWLSDLKLAHSKSLKS